MEERKMFSGDWSCASCDTKISELPFEPRDTSNLLCRDCHRAQRADRPRKERTMFQGSWTCAGCNGAITELPFQPRDESNLKCRDCFKKEKGFV